jgi:hypothetical protein
MDEALPANIPLLNWIHGFSAQDITAVGNDGTVIHYDGSTWSEQATPTVEHLWGVWGATPDDLWAVGGNGNAGSAATMIHYDGSAWSNVTVPTLQRADVFAFFKVWGRSADDIVVVGQKGALLHYDGVSWQERLVGAPADLISVWGDDNDVTLAVGGRASGILSLESGGQWASASLSPFPGINGVWVDDATKTGLLAVTRSRIARVDLALAMATATGTQHPVEIIEPVVEVDLGESAIDFQGLLYEGSF